MPSATITSPVTPAGRPKTARPRKAAWDTANQDSRLDGDKKPLRSFSGFFTPNFWEVFLAFLFLPGRLTIRLQVKKYGSALVYLPGCVVWSVLMLVYFDFYLPGLNGCLPACLKFVDGLTCM